MYNNQFIQDLKDQRTNFIEQIKLIDAMLKLNGIDLSEDEPITPYGGLETVLFECPYKKNATSQEKFAALLKQTNRFMTINEIAGMVLEYETKLKPDDVKNSLGSAKNLLLKARAIVKYQLGTNNSNSFYGSPSWLGEDGKPLAEHMYNEQAVKVRSVITI